jgi:hypothetical protein
MMPLSRPLAVAAWLFLGARIVNAALNLDGTQAVEPLGKSKFRISQHLLHNF